MVTSDWVILPTSGLQVLVLKDPEILESNPSWTVILCQLCSDKRLITIRWSRKNGKPFPSILNQTGLVWETLEVAGDYTIHTYIEHGQMVQSMNVVASEVKIYSSDEPIVDGCEIRITTDEEERRQRDLRTCIKYLRMKITQDTYMQKLKRQQPSDSITEMLMEKFEGLKVSPGSAHGKPEEKKSTVQEGDDSRGSSLRDAEITLCGYSKNVKGAVAEKWAIFEQKGGWISNSNSTADSKISLLRICS
jgi:hypothetical protein